MGVLLAYALGTSLLEAARSPFWYDEIFTVVIADLPSMRHVVEALSSATDTSGLAYYVLVRAASGLLTDPELSHRLPSVLAGTVASAAVYLFAKRDLGPLAGATAVLVMLLSRLNHGYSVEARPYAVMMMFLCVAALAWQRAASWRWTVLLGASVALAVASHYYAVFALIAFAVAEFAYSLRRRHVRAGVWLALSMGGVSLALVWPLLASLRTYYGPTYWSKPTVGKVMAAYDWAFFAGMPGAGFGLAIVLGAAMLLLLVRLWPCDEDLDQLHPAPETLVLVIMLLATPLTTFVVTRVMQGGFADRYALGMLAGIGLAVAYAARALDIRKQALVALALLCLFSASELVFWATLSRPSPLATQQALVGQGRQAGLPLVVEGGQDFLALDFYDDGVDSGLIYLIDTEASRRYSGTDSLDLDLIALQRYRPMNVVNFERFRSEHREFLLLSNFGAMTWWPTRLLDEEFSLTLVSRSSRHALFRVRSPDN